MSIAVGVAEPSAPASPAAMVGYRARTSHTPDWWLTYKYWDDTPAASEMTNAAAVSGGVIVTLEPWLSDRTTGISLTSIASGGQDVTLAKFASWCAAATVPVILRFGHEMNGNWYPWGTANSAADFIAAYQYVVTYFRAHAPAVTHLWCPNTNPPDAPTFPFSDRYPGDAYVDYIGLDGYNWVAIKGAPSHTLDFIMGSSYDVITALAPSKPFVIGETSCNPVGVDKAQWILQELLTTVPVRMPKTVIMCWFDYDRSGSGEADWRINSSPEVLAAWTRVINDPRYGGTLPPANTGRPSRGVVSGVV